MRHAGAGAQARAKYGVADMPEFDRGFAPRFARPDTVIETGDGDCPSWVFAPEGDGPWPGVILFMDGYGLRDTLFAMGQRLADLGYVVLVPDMYYRNGGYRAATRDEIAAPSALFERLLPWISSTDNLKAIADTKAFLAYLAVRLDVDNAAGVGAVGYCMGGGMALAAAGSYGTEIAAAASFHGGRLATDADTSPHLRVPGIKGRVYVAAAANDPFYPADMNARLVAAFDAAGVDYAVEVYEGADHGWTMPDFPVYDHAAAERHWTAMTLLFRKTLVRP